VVQVEQICKSLNSFHCELSTHATPLFAWEPWLLRGCDQ
jgi:hypothetical protein